MGNKAFRWMLVAFLAIAASFGSVARADIDSGTNVQEGDNESDVDQDGASASGDAVAGQVIGSVGGGDVSIDATNRSEDVDIETGDAEATNEAASFTGLTAGTSTTVAADILNRGRGAVNVQEGDNDSDINQDASASTGDGVGGQVIGVVTTWGGSADIVAANTSLDVDIETGDAEAHNDASAFVGLNASGTVTLDAADIFNASATNVQEGDNDLDADQDARAASGDGVGGQVLGVVSAGDASVSATNWSEDVDVETGEAYAENDFAAFVGLTAGSATTLDAADHLDRFELFNRSALNVQEGENDKSISQFANASSGDAVGGQVAGVVTSAGGSADLVLANTSVDAEAESGDGDFENEDYSFTGLNAGGLIDVF